MAWAAGAARRCIQAGMRARSRLDWLGSTLLAAGIVLLAAAITQYGFMFAQQARLRAKWNAAARVASAPDRASAAAATRANASAAASGPIRMVIPKIGLDDMVARGVGYGALLAGPGWMKGTAPPGARGNMVIAGHRDTFFQHVHELQPGDWVILRRGGRAFRYRVTTQYVIKPSDVAVLAATSDAELTLVTCYPTFWVGPAPDRLIVRARLAPGAGAAESAAPAAGAQATTTNR